MHTRFQSRLVILGALSTLLAATACGPKGPVQVPMSYTPKDDLEVESLSGAALTTPLAIGEIADKREVEPNAIGENVEDEAVPVLAKPEAIEASIREAFESVLGEAGVQVKDGADVSLNIEVMKLWVSEDNTYNATARFKVTVMRAGAATQSVVVEGTAKQFGSSMKGENYREVLSDAMLEAVQNLINSSEFRSSLES